MLEIREIQEVRDMLREIESLRTGLVVRINQLDDALNVENPSDLHMLYIADCATRINNVADELKERCRILNEYCYDLACESTGHKRRFEFSAGEWILNIPEENTTEVPADEPV